MTAGEMCRAATDTAELALQAQGEVLTMVLLHVIGRGVIGLPYKDGSAPVGVQQQVIISVIKEYRKLGAFDGLVLMSEAWMVPQKSEVIAQVLRPAQDPDRKEVFVANAYGADGSKCMVTADIVREGDKVRLGPVEVVKHKVESWLDDAFMD